MNRIVGSGLGLGLLSVYVGELGSWNASTFVCRYPLEDLLLPAIKKVYISCSQMPLSLERTKKIQSLAQLPTPFRGTFYLNLQRISLSLDLLVKKKKLAQIDAFQLYFTITHSENHIFITYFICKYVFSIKQRLFLLYGMHLTIFLFYSVSCVC